MDKSAKSARRIRLTHASRYVICRFVPSSTHRKVVMRLRKTLTNFMTIYRSRTPKTASRFLSGWTASGQTNWRSRLPIRRHSVRAQYYGHLKEKASAAMEQGKRNFHDEDSCLGLIMACIERGMTRDEIVKTVPRHSRCSFRHVGYLLGQGTGDDPSLCLWRRGDDKRYELLKGY